jgi:hypothetical protein
VQFLKILDETLLLERADHDEIRPERKEALKIYVGELADLREVGDFGRIIAVLGDTDHSISRSHRKEDLRSVRREGYDAARFAVEHNFSPEIVPNDRLTAGGVQALLTGA